MSEGSGFLGLALIGALGYWYYTKTKTSTSTSTSTGTGTSTGSTPATTNTGPIEFYSGPNYTGNKIAIANEDTSNDSLFAMTIGSIKTNGQLWQVWSGTLETGQTMTIGRGDYPDATALLTPLGGHIHAVKKVG